jgi:hypothetical protein
LTQDVLLSPLTASWLTGWSIDFTGVRSLVYGRLGGGTSASTSPPLMLHHQPHNEPMDEDDAKGELPG